MSASTPASSATPEATAELSRRPDILLVISDQHHADVIGALGCAGVQTPTLDFLRARGVSCSAAYCASPLCSPARAAVFTGRLPHETGVIDNNISIRDGLPTLGQILGEAGYRCAYAGKWHVPDDYTRNIPGFDVISTGHKHHGTTSDSTVTEAAVHWWTHHADSEQPLCLVVSYMQPHDVCNWLRHQRDEPAQVRYPEIDHDLPELPANRTSIPSGESAWVQQHRAQGSPSQGQWSDRHAQYYLWNYYRQVEMVDAELERVVRTMQATGRWDRTVVVYTSDHGEGLMHHGMDRKNTLYDESSRVPLLISGPGIPRGGSCGQPIAGYDVMPTLCHIAGVSTPPSSAGLDISPAIINDRPLPRAGIIIEAVGAQGWALRTPQWKYIIDRTVGQPPTEQLFDMQHDPNETENRSEDPVRAVVLAECQHTLAALLAHSDWDPRVLQA